MKFIFWIILTLTFKLSVFSQANLPTYCSAFDVGLPSGWTNTGALVSAPTHDECSGNAKTFNAVGIRLTINYNTAASHLKYSISRNNNVAKTMLVEESPDGITWTTIFTHTNANTPIPAAIHIRPLNPLSRFVRFNMTVRNPTSGGRMEIDMVNIYNGTPDPLGNCKLLNLNCLDAKSICSDGSFTANNDDFGAQELNAGNSGCLSTENQSNWFFFEPMSSGTMEFLISAGSGVDYDFAVWTGSCATLGTPIRCSFAASTVPTGLSSAAVDLSEGISGDAIVAPLSLVVGQTYILFIDNFTANTTPFTIDFTLGGGASLDCTPNPLPIGLLQFEGKINDEDNLLTWATVSEQNNDHFTLERSRNGYDFEILGNVAGAGTSTSVLFYSLFDYDPFPGTSYYRLKQTDYDGQYFYSQIIALNRGMEEAILSDLFPNPANNSVNFELNTPKSGTVNVEMFDNTGRLIATQTYEAHVGSNNFNIDISQFARGVYSTVIRFEHLESLEIKQLIKQ
jgi:hypothetical protein